MDRLLHIAALDGMEGVAGTSAAAAGTAAFFLFFLWSRIAVQEAEVQTLLQDLHSILSL